MSTNDGGLAFPISREAEGWYEPGMTLRDYFAAQALAGLYTQERTITEHKWAAREAYAAADAMLAARTPQESEASK